MTGVTAIDQPLVHILHMRGFSFSNQVNVRARRQEYVLAGAVVLFFVNDVGFILTTTTAQFLAVDFAFRTAVLVLLATTPGLRDVVTGFLRYKGRLSVLATWVAGLCVSAYLIWVLEFFLDELIGGWRLFSYPAIDSTPLFVLDITFGLALVALTEEAVFRAGFLIIGRARNWSPLAVLLISSAVFALVHWSLGVGNVIAAFVTGIAFMVATMRTGSLLPAVAAHYLVNLVLFFPPGLPQSLFDFLTGSAPGS